MSDLLQSGHHPDADQLSAFVEHALPPHERQETLAHLAVCPECRTIVALSLPAVEAVEITLPERPAPRAWWMGWRLAFPAATALAATVILIAVLHNNRTAADRTTDRTTDQIADRNAENSSAPAQMAVARPPEPPSPTTSTATAAPQSSPALKSPAQPASAGAGSVSAAGKSL